MDATKVGLPKGKSRIARKWFSNCDVVAPSIVQWPELVGPNLI